MFTVTQRIKMVLQPQNGYISPKLFTEEQFEDNYTVSDVDPAVKSLQGTVVDYLTRYILFNSAEKAFHFPLLGAMLVSQTEKANELLKEIHGLDDNSIKCACLIANYESAYRLGPKSYSECFDSSLIDNRLILNIRFMVDRCCAFFKKHGPAIDCGFTMEGGYNRIVSKGDGDFLTNDTLWDLKTSANSINKDQTLQIAVYYILGVHSVHPVFQGIKHLGIFNPYLNRAYRIDISAIDESVFSDICRKVIGYSTPKDCHRWRESKGTNIDLLISLIRHKDTGFRPNRYKDGIYDITVDDYWSYINRNNVDIIRPKFTRTKSVKFLKKNGFLMFVSVSNKGVFCVLKGASLKRLNKPIEYYYEKMDVYGNFVLSIFSQYWNMLYALARVIRSIQPDRNSALLESKCQDETAFSGYVHGCIIDLDYTNHLFLNPIDGIITPYNAPRSMYERYTYSNIASLIAEKRPEMLPGYQELQRQCNESSSKVAELLSNENNKVTPFVDKSMIEGIKNDMTSFHDEEKIDDSVQLETDTSMYRLSNRLLELQRIYDEKLIVVWCDEVIKQLELDEGNLL